MPVRVHAVGMRSGTDAAANRAAAVAAVEDAVGSGAGPGTALVVLPEYAAAFDPRGVTPELAEPLDGPFVGALRAATAGSGALVVAGTTLPGSRPDRAVNAVVVVRDGDVVAAYRKVHLYDAFGHRESDRLEPGPADAQPVVVRVGGLTVGVMTCYDLRFPEVARRLVDAGADVLVVPAAWADGEHKADHWTTLLRARAIESTAYVVGAAQQGRGVTGASCVVDPLGVVLAAAGGRGADDDASPGTAAVASLDPDVVTAVRERNPSLANRRYRVVPGAPVASPAGPDGPGRTRC
ncbi:nitrilase-related carbon-nitrogen hydrolase [Cellulomonas carbonis]|uniref:Hydrolase n=1 Tax=Cellulomonas carbonis T26 TaxID=947969 RepID=A0A0A0BXP0_9CELL|nr:nitrilase-related carbon-nitrogen hydrolase [Cellulomonas carbonis]KGM12467.1 hydrolase [Cellulomonas carbonis T26]GGC15537.1 hydrolase [Cellulomonas carbonis]